MLRILGNIIWLLLGGLEMAILWFLVGIILMISIIGIPWARASFNIALFVLWPFGRVSVDRAAFAGEKDLGTGGLGMIGNILWMIFAGLWLALGHLISAALVAITIIGIPLAIQHIKIAGMALMPIGKMIVTKEDAASKGIVY